MARLNGQFGGVFSIESWTLSQSYYYGSVGQNPSHQVALVEGTCIDLLGHLDEFAIGKPTKRDRNAKHGPAPDVRLGDIEEKRLRGLATTLLDNLGEAKDGEKHNALLKTARTLGGYLPLIGWSENEAVEHLIAALPASVKDWDLARRTALEGVRKGTTEPLELEQRPAPRRRKIARGPEELPTIIVGAGDHHLAADAGLAAMHRGGVQFYRRDKQIVRVLRISQKLSDGTEVSVPAVVPVGPPQLNRALGQTAKWRKHNHKHELVGIEPPATIANQVLGMVDEWPFPVLRGVIATQTMRHNGTLLTKPGYDAATGLLLFEPPPMLPIPDQPSRGDALDALALLDGLLSEFVFADDHDVSRSAAASMMMTAVLRGAMDVAPMHVITKPEPGTGGSYLQDLVAAIAIGKRCPVMSLTGNDEENEKRLTAAALTQQPIIALDNVSTFLTGDFLCQLIERPEVQCRRLGGSDFTDVPNSAFVIANGNNLTIAADTVRRVIRIGLDANMEHPEARVFNRNPVAEVLADRGRYVRAVLTIARAYFAAGMPKRLPPRASFGRWSDVVRSALVWLGWADPALSVDKVRAEDPVRGAFVAVASAWVNELQIDTPYTTGELISRANEVCGDERVRPALWEALLAVAASKNGQIDAAKLGLWLKSNVNRHASGHKLLVNREINKARPHWLLVSE
jgi:hypothetical protein